MKDSRLEYNKAMKKIIPIFALGLISISLPSFSQAQTTSPNPIPAIGSSGSAGAADKKMTTVSETNAEFFATVNGQPISTGLLALNIRNAMGQGQKDGPELQNALKQELINRKLLTDEATKKGLERLIDFPDQYTQLKQTLLIQALVENHFSTNPITDAQLQTEYERQRKLVGESASAFQYYLSQIVVPSKEDAEDLILRFQKGEPFGTMAQAYSIDQATKGSGGQLGWLFPGQVIKPIADVVVKMNKSAITTTPIQTSEGWVIIRLDDKRPFKFPSLEEAKPQLRQAMVQQYLVETVKKLRETAKIVQ